MYNAIINRARMSAKELKREGRMMPLVNLAQKAWQFKKNSVDYMNANKAVAELEALPPAPPLEQVAGLVLNGLDGFMKPIQNENELLGLVRRVSQLEPSIVMEIGTAKGGTLFLLSKAAKKDALIISCDLPGGFYGGGYPEWKVPIFKRLIPPPQTLQLIRGDSHDPTTKAQVGRVLGGRAIDVLFIDGDHSCQGVKQDFMLYRDLVRPGGLIGFHDILPNRFDRDIDVSRFWDEIKSKYQTEEIVNDRDQGNLGIGLLVVPETW